MSLVVRTWNVFHGNALPPRRRGYLREMIELACRDQPDVLCLQELPVWGISRLDEWSSMQSFAVVARAPRVPGPIGVRVTRMNQGFFRSAFVGQANAILVGRSLEAEDRGHLQISDPGRERRLAQAVGVAGSFVIVNLHANHGDEVAQMEVERSQAFAEAASRPGRSSFSWETSTSRTFDSTVSPPLRPASTTSSSRAPRCPNPLSGLASDASSTESFSPTIHRWT